MRMCRHRFTVVMTTLQNWHCDHLFSGPTANREREGKGREDSLTKTASHHIANGGQREKESLNTSSLLKFDLKVHTRTRTENHDPHRASETETEYRVCMCDFVKWPAHECVGSGDTDNDSLTLGVYVSD